MVRSDLEVLPRRQIVDDILKVEEEESTNGRVKNTCWMKAVSEWSKAESARQQSGPPESSYGLRVHLI